MKNILKTWFKKSLILALCWVTIMFMLCFKYVSEGECAAIVYYLPMGILDYVYIFLIGSIFMFVSYCFTKKTSSRTDFWIEGLIYIVGIVLICYFGNDILASREVEWPHHYHPTPYK